MGCRSWSHSVSGWKVTKLDSPHAAENPKATVLTLLWHGLLTVPTANLAQVSGATGDPRSGDRATTRLPRHDKREIQTIRRRGGGRAWRESREAILTTDEHG